MKAVTILGSTGSIGTQALDVVRRNPDRFKVVGLSAAGANQDLLVGQIREFLPPIVAIADEDAARDIKAKLGPDPRRRAHRRARGHRDARPRVRDRHGAQRAGRIGRPRHPRSPRCRRGKTLALANKESLVVGGELVTDLIKGEPERLLPVDSEHAALAMAMRGERREDLKRVVLTGSGGPVPRLDAQRARDGPR